jgi:3-methyl-2-oxobutanoate hydroxymethyltransferase
VKNSVDFITMKKNQEKIAMITAYDYPTGKYVEKAKADIILVGDSVGMVALGYDSTIPVTMEDMIHHTKAVKRGAQDTFIVTDMPFMSYHLSMETTLANAKRIIQEAGAHAVKVEGGGEVVTVIKKLTTAGIPVVAHLGLTPQSVGVIGGYKVQGRDAESANVLIEEAKKIQEAGAFALVLECIPQEVAKKVSEKLVIPTIGIGAGSHTDGQVLVINDLLSYGVDRVPKFVKKYANVGEVVEQGLLAYVEEVKSSAFPQQEHTYKMKDDQIEKLYGGK